MASLSTVRKRNFLSTIREIFWVIVTARFVPGSVTQVYCLSHEGLLSEAEGGNKAGEIHVHVVRVVSQSVR